MGQAKIKQSKIQRFLSYHPVCCFCGGGRQATSRDHVPNRAFFTDRDWPLGYEFPACDTCQGTSRVGELVSAAVARVRPQMTQEELKQVGKLYEGFANNDREAFREFVGPERTSSLALPRAVQARLHTPQGDAVMNIGDRIQTHLKDYIIKLVKALYYKHANKILLAGAIIEPFMISNAHIGTPQERLLSELPQFPGVPTLIGASSRKTGKPLTEQFEYSYVISNISGDAIFKVRFHQSFLFVATVKIPAEGQEAGAAPSSP